MKRFFLILISVVASFGLYAETGGKEVVVKTSMDNSEVLLATVEIELSEVIYPYVITVPAPSETVLSISGPSQPNIGSWYISVIVR